MKKMPKPRQIYVHLLVHDPVGLIETATTNLRVACSPKSLMPESGSTVAMESVITCPLCLKSAEYLELNEDIDAVSHADRAAADHVAELEAAATLRESPEVTANSKPPEATTA
jgi:hypothetical protein